MPIRDDCGMQIFTDCLGNVSFHINEEHSKLRSSFNSAYLVLCQSYCCSPPFLTCGPIRLHHPFCNDPSIKASSYAAGKEDERWTEGERDEPGLFVMQGNVLVSDSWIPIRKPLAITLPSIRLLSHSVKCICSSVE